MNQEVFKNGTLHQNHEIGCASCLHPGFYDIQGRVSKDTGSARRGSKHCRHNWVHFFSGVVTLTTNNGVMHSNGKTGLRLQLPLDWDFIFTFVPVS